MREAMQAIDGPAIATPADRRPPALRSSHPWLAGLAVVVAMVVLLPVVALGAVAVLLGILFKGQNVAYMVSLAFAIAASGNFPALVLSIFWRRCTTEGIVSSMVVGTLSTLVLIWLSPTIQVDILKHAGAWFPLKNPALVTIPLSFAVGVLVSLATRDAVAAERFTAVERRMHVGEA